MKQCVTFSSNRLKQSELLQDLDEKCHDHQDGDHLEAIQVHHSGVHSLHCKPRSENLLVIPVGFQQLSRKLQKEKLPTETKNPKMVRLSQPYNLEHQKEDHRESERKASRACHLSMGS